MSRRILQLEGERIAMRTEARFATERQLHDAVAAHPEVLPSEDLGLGPLLTLGTEVDFGAGPIDLLAADPAGQIAIVEFKRGSENRDVRAVVAQLLDYGASLWRTGYEELERCCSASRAGCDPLQSAAEACEGLDVPFDPDAFRAGVERTLESGEFVFLYVAGDLDEHTRRIMTYLARGPG
jgi:hypothetical protein